MKRFYDDGNGISGIVIADNFDEATSRAEQYTNNTILSRGAFSTGTNTQNKAIVLVWKAVDDDDYNEKYPFALVV